MAKMRNIRGAFSRVGDFKQRSTEFVVIGELVLPPDLTLLEGVKGFIAGKVR